MEILSKDEKKALVIILYKEGKIYKEIAKIVRISPRDIGIIINEYTRKKTMIYAKSNSSKAYALFLKGKSPIEVAIKLDLGYEEAMKAYTESLNLQGMKSVETIYRNYKNYLPNILLIIDKIREGEITVEEFGEFCKCISDIPTLQRTVGELRHKINMLRLRDEDDT